MPATSDPLRLVVLVSGAGTNLAALIDACTDPRYRVEIGAVGADRSGIAALERAEAAGIPTFVERVKDHPDRATWDLAMAEACAAYSPDLVVSAGFMKLAGDAFLARFGGRYLNTHPALLPSFPGTNGAGDALDYGVRITGATLFVVDAGVDTGPILEQTAVKVEHDDTVESLHERIKVAERAMLVDAMGRIARHGLVVEGRTARIGGHS